MLPSATNTTRRIGIIAQQLCAHSGDVLRAPSIRSTAASHQHVLTASETSGIGSARNLTSFSDSDKIFSLPSKVAIITGAGSGIGRAAASIFAKHGASIVAADVNQRNLDKVAAEVQAVGGQIKTVRADVSNEDDVNKIMDLCTSSFGVPDVYFANAGIAGIKLFQDITVEDFSKILNVNVLGSFLCMKSAAAVMKDAGKSGSIIATASVAGLRSGAGDTAYSASKAAVISLVQTFTNQLQGTGIRVNAICPGLTETGMTAPIFDLARARGKEKSIGQLNPLRRAASADEVANVALFLASDASSYVNGQAIPICGGLSSSHPVVPGRFF